MSTKEVIALAGLSGAGKSTLLRAVLTRVPFLHLSASDLIKEQDRLESGRESSSESLRKGNVSNNQELLVNAFVRRTNGVGSHIALDCHTVIDTPHGLQELPVSTFSELGVTRFLFLSVDPHVLFERRILDTSRERPLRTVEELEGHQDSGIRVARKIATSLGVPFAILSGGDSEERILSLLKPRVDESH